MDIYNFRGFFFRPYFFSRLYLSIGFFFFINIWNLQISLDTRVDFSTNNHRQCPIFFRPDFSMMLEKERRSREFRLIRMTDYSKNRLSERQLIRFTTFLSYFLQRDR